MKVTETSPGTITREFRKLDDTYYISAYGDVLNAKTGRILRPNTQSSGHLRVDMHGRHELVHRKVYEAWGPRPLKPGEQVNHKDDVKINNHISNLYAGSQKQNIADCVRNGHRKGHFKSLVVKDKTTGEVMKFGKSSDFFAKSGHPSANGAISKAMRRDWFKNKYEVLYFGNERLEHLDNV